MRKRSDPRIGVIQRSPIPSVQTEAAVAHILIVDDEPSNLLALEAILEPLGQKVVRAGSGVEALKHALKTEFACVLLDVQMPDMDGFETAELLRKRPSTRDVPILFLTAISKDRRFVARGYDVGAVDYLFKPYDPDILRSKVAVFVELARKNAIIRAQHDALQELSARELADFKRWSERRYSDLADAMPQIVWIADSEGRIQVGNQRWDEIATAPGFDFADILHPEDLPRFLEGWNAAIACGEPWEAELRFGNANVGYLFHLVRAVPRKDESGEIVAWIGTSTDIDARVRATRSLRMLADASRGLAQSFEEPTQMGAVLRSALPVLGDAAILELANERMRSAVDTVPQGLLDDPRFELGPSTVCYTRRPEIYLDVMGETEEAASSRGVENLKFLSQLGVTGYMCLPLLTRDRCVGTLTFMRFANNERYTASDVELAEDLASRVAIAADNVRLHEQTEKRREELEQANKSKDVFLATLSHELRTPLNAIVGWTDMMRNGQLKPDELTRAIDTIDRNAHALNGLVADLLDVSRIVTGTLKIDQKLVGLAAVVEAAVEAARPQCTAKECRLELLIEDVGRVRGDAGRLRQVVANLLSNALKFTPRGGKITVRVERTADQARLVIADTGEGITPEFLPHVFERFRQAETARARGLGLGLAIVKHLVTEHGGTVIARSEGKGKGAEFTVDLPIAEGSARAEDEEARGSHPPSGDPTLAGVHVLIVEDDPDGNELIRTILERFGARVTSVGTASAALVEIDKERPDVLVSDIGLPDMDGFELIKQIRARPDSSALPAVALTAYASRQDATKAISAGFDAHIAKPVQPSALGGVVAKVRHASDDPKKVDAA